MSVRIRLKRTGMQKQSSYRIVVADARKQRDGRSIDVIGDYSPYKKNKPLTVNLDKVDKWIKNGAQMSEPAAKLIERARKASEVQGTRIVSVTSPPKPRKPSKKAKAKANAPESAQV